MIRRVSLSFLAACTVFAMFSTHLAAQRGGRGAAGGGGSAAAGPATVEFIATTADGQLAADLTASQVTLRVSGRDRAISSLDLVRFGTTASSLAAPFGTNDLAGAGRTYVIVVDEESIRTGLEGPVRDSLLAFEKQLSGQDRLSLFTVPRGSTSLAPTSDREAFRAAVARVQGRQKTSASEHELRCHTRDVLTSFSSVVGGISAGGGLTPVVLFTSGLVGPSASTSLMRGGDGGVTTSSNPGGVEECFLPPSAFQQLGPVADNARAQVYIVRPEEAGAGASEGLENVAGVTGGQLLYLGGAENAMTRIARETAGYYIATFTAEANERTGASTRVEVRTSRPDVTIRTRSTTALPRATREAPSATNMLRELTVHRGFGLRAIGVASRNDGDAKNDMKLIALAEPTDPSVKLQAAAAGVYDPAGKLIAQWTARSEELQRSPLVAAMAIPAGQYRLRVAAVDTSGRAATADYDVFARTTDAGPAKIGGLMIGTTGANGFAPMVRITDQQELIVVFELYGRPAGPFGAIVEIVDDPAADKGLVEAAPTPSATPVQDKFMFTATLPIASLKPGDYQLRVRLGFEGHPTGTLTQTIRKQ